MSDIYKVFKDDTGIPEYQITILGMTGVGKSSLIQRYTKGEFSPNYIPNLLENIYYKFQYKGKTGVLKILDPIGTNEFESLFDQYIEVSQGFAVMYAINSEESLNKARELLGRIKLSHPDDSSIVIIGNKCDLDEEKRQVARVDGSVLAQEYEGCFFESSCITGEGVNQAFESLIRMLNNDDGRVGGSISHPEMKPEDENGKNAVVLILAICLIVLIGVGFIALFSSSKS